MKVTIDNQLFLVNLGKVCQHLQSLYDQYNHTLETPIELEVKKGKKRKIDFSRKSLLRTGLKAALVPFVNPMLEALYTSKGLELPVHEKHTDYIDYLVRSILNYAALTEKEIKLYVQTVQVDTNNTRIVSTISTTRQDTPGLTTGRREEISEPSENS